MTPYLVPALEWALALTGLVAWWLGTSCWLESMGELTALKVTRQNGALMAAARHHFWRSSVRAGAGLMSVACGVWLVCLPNDAHVPDLIAKTCWLAYQCAMILNLGIERWARHKAIHA